MNITQGEEDGSRVGQPYQFKIKDQPCTTLSVR